jgi:hypothetical protein
MLVGRVIEDPTRTGTREGVAFVAEPRKGLLGPDLEELAGAEIVGREGPAVLGVVGGQKVVDGSWVGPAPLSRCTTARGFSAMFRAFRVRGPVLKRNRPSSQTPQTGIA